MFSEIEQQKLKNLLNPDPSLVYSLLDENELLAVGNKSLIKDDLFLPNHNRPIKTIRLKKLFMPDLDFHQFIKNVLGCIDGTFEIVIGVSILVHSRQFWTSHSADDIKYFFAIPHRPVNPDNRMITSYQDAQNLLQYLKKFDHHDLLHHVFHVTNSENPFERSDFMPRGLVLCTCWITKTN